MTRAYGDGASVVLHQYDPPVHQWIAGEAFQIARARLPAAAVAEFSVHIPERTVATVNGFLVWEYPETFWQVIKGTREEDSADETECVNHFWDPDGGANGGIPWFGDENAYQRAQRYWGEATAAYAAGNTNTAFCKLGRISHLLTDMTVPAHVHNDQHLWRDSFETYMTEFDADYAGHYNYHLWDHGGLDWVVKATLYDFFHDVAELTDEYESDDDDGEDSAHEEDHHGAWEEQRDVFGYYDTSYAECRVHGNALMPLAIRNVAGLYKLFWDTVRPPPAVPAGVLASDGNPTNFVRVTWTAVSGATRYQVVRADTSTGTLTAVSDWIATNRFDDTTVDRGAVCWYSVRSRHAYNDSEPGVADAGHTPPAPPWFIAASFGSYTDRITVTWNAMPNAGQYQLSRATASNGTRSVVMPWQAMTGFVDTNVVDMQSYYYWAQSRGPCGDSEFSQMSEGWRRGRPPAPPSWVSASDGALTDRVAVCWAPAPGATGYRLYRATSVTGTLTEVTGWWVAATNYDDLTALALTSYTYRVQANGDWGSGAMSSAFDTGWKSPLPPPAPTGLTASDGVHTDRVAIAWSAATGATEYKVYRSRTYDGQRTELTDWRTGLACADYAVSPGLEYYYWVRARGPWGESGFSDRDWGYSAYGPPQAPHSIHATQNGFGDCVVVSWSSSSSGQPWNERYRLYRGTSPTTTVTLVRNWDPTPSYWDYGIGTCTAYYYRAQTTNCWGLSPLSEAAAGWRYSLPARPAGLGASYSVYTNRVDVWWAPSPLAESYRVCRYDGSGTYPASGWIAATNYTDCPLQPDRFYVYVVQAANSWGLSETSNATLGRTRGMPPAPPSDVGASDGTQPDRVYVSWSEFAWTAHRVCRATNAWDEGIPITDWLNVNPGGYGDTSAQPGVLYYYRVQGRNTWGDGGWSLPDSGWWGSRPDTVAAPLLSPPPALYTNAALSVTLACATAGATIRYTTDGRDPTPSDPAVASGGAVSLGRSCPLKARAWKSGLFDSPVAGGNYTLTRGNSRLLAVADRGGLLRVLGLDTRFVFAEAPQKGHPIALIQAADLCGDGQFELLVVHQNEETCPAECRDLLTLDLLWRTESPVSFALCGNEHQGVHVKACDLDGDGEAELLLPHELDRHSIPMRRHAARTGAEESELQFRSCCLPAEFFDPSDGHQKVLLIRSDTGSLACLDPAATEEPLWEIGSAEGMQIGAIGRSLADGLPRIWQGGLDRWVGVYDRRGDMLWHRSFGGGQACVVYGGRLAPDAPEVLLVGGVYAAGEARLAAVSIADGDVFWEARIRDLGDRMEVMAAEDLDGDGILEVLGIAPGQESPATAPSYFCLSGRDGDPLWIRPYAVGTHLVNLARFADMNGDGTRDVLVAVNDAVAVLDGRHGDTLDAYAMPDTVTAFDLVTDFWDTDRDGQYDWQEKAAGSAVVDPQSALRFTACRSTPDGGVTVEWLSASNRHYTIEYATAPESGYRPLPRILPATPPTNALHYVPQAPHVSCRLRLSE